MLFNAPEPSQAVTAFKLPISFLDKKLYVLADNIKSDLELKEVYHKTLQVQPQAVFAAQTAPLWSQHYTSHVPFLEDSQTLLASLTNLPPLALEVQHTLFQIAETESGSAGGDGDGDGENFKEKYQFVQHKWFEGFNHNAGFLQCLSLYNMTSPILSLMVPIIFIILPFLILKLQGIPISVDRYVEILKTLFKRHQLGQLLNFNANAGYDKIIYMVISLAFYVIQIYQNIMSCKKFYNNMDVIHAQLFAARDFAKITVEYMDAFKEQCSRLRTYDAFVQTLEETKVVLHEMYEAFSTVLPYRLTLHKIGQIGYVMKCFYALHKNTAYNGALRFAGAFHGYLENLHGLRQQLQSQKVNLCKFLQAPTVADEKAVAVAVADRKKKNKKNKKDKTKEESRSITRFTDAHFPLVASAAPVCNTYTLAKQALITGPNAAGKTTLLKTTLCNIILSQQFGVGYYATAELWPYDGLHSYINIPDTAGRDSLFQAEARRCKEILTQITEDPSARHFCIFDELYSGTNPYEAISSAYGFLKFLNQRDNTTFMLTTHFLELCHRLEKEPHMQNYCMHIEEVGTAAHDKAASNTDASDTVQDQGDVVFKYTYQLTEGLSAIKGGVKVLQDLDYPPEIIQDAKRISKELFI
jgi:hypothetical protein